MALNFKRLSIYYVLWTPNNVLLIINKVILSKYHTYNVIVEMANTQDINKSLLQEFNKLMHDQWSFLYQSWPEVSKTKFHRTETKSVNDIQHVKDTVLQRLGYIPVFFFLTILFITQDYPGPYRNSEKGLLILYQLIKNCSMEQMSRFIPRSSFYDLYRSFYIKQSLILDKRLTSLLASMFSNIQIRVLTAQQNPSLFKHVTLLLDGHDTRVNLAGAEAAKMYSYKFKKSGLRTQVCVDNNSMILFLSKSAPCGDSTDGVMLTKIKLEKHIHKLDCVGLDGGYTQHINKVIESSDLNLGNFCHPVCKSKGIELSSDEVKYNKIFGSFRSKIESVFGELGAVFERFNNQSVIRTCDSEIFNLQFKLASLLMNIKKFVDLGKIQTQPHHLYWTQTDFDYSDGTAEIVVESTTLQDQRQHASDMLSCQRKLLELDIGEEDDKMEDERIYEVEKILSHRKRGRHTEYQVQWKGFKETTWETMDKFNSTECIDDYLESIHEDKDL